MTRPYSLAFKQKMVERLTGKDAISANQLSRETGVRQQNLSRWLEEARSLPAVGADAATGRADRVDSLALLVRTWGHEVATARDAPTALTVAENFEPDVALLDIGLPGINGCDLARRLRDATHRRPLHLVAMTGYGREEDRRAAQDAGFEVHLVKQPDIDAIRKLLAALR